MPLVEHGLLQAQWKLSDDTLFIIICTVESAKASIYRETLRCIHHTYFVLIHVCILSNIYFCTYIIYICRYV